MTANERRMALLEVLCLRRHDTRENLAFEFGVSKRTIEYDVQILSANYPIYSVQGKGGGIYVMEGFELYKKYLTDKQTVFLRELAVTLLEEDKEVVLSILKDFSKFKGGGVAIMTIKEIKAELREVQYYYLHKAAFDGAVKLIGNNTVLEKVERYNKIMQTAPAKFYDLYIGLYVNGYTQEAYAVETGYYPSIYAC